MYLELRQQEEEKRVKTIVCWACKAIYEDSNKRINQCGVCGSFNYEVFKYTKKQLKNKVFDLHHYFVIEEEQCQNAT